MGVIFGMLLGLLFCNDVCMVLLDWSDVDLVGGQVYVQVYKQDFLVFYGVMVVIMFQDVSFVLLGQLIDQFEVVVDKVGVKLSWVWFDLLFEGLELIIGLDWFKDMFEQCLVLIQCIWVLLLKFISMVFFVQFEYDFGVVIICGGVCCESVYFEVDSYKIFVFYKYIVVQGGECSFD